jgi:hypothetical protein
MVSFMNVRRAFFEGQNTLELLGFKVSNVSHSSNHGLARHAIDWHGRNTFRFPRIFDPAEFLSGFKVSGPMFGKI